MTIEDKLCNLLEKGVSPFHVVEASEQELKEAGFQSLSMNSKWEIKAGNKYYVNHHGTTLIAFTIGEEYKKGDSIRIAAAHTDFPCLRIKPNPQVNAGGYGQLNVEVYGGAILNTWLDRPLSVAGQVAVRGKDAFHPERKLVDFKKPILYIPNLAIHMNREVNKGVELNKQTDLLPILTMLKEELPKKDIFMQMLAEELKVKMEDILDYELTIYCAEKPSIMGKEEEFISAPRLDNLTSVTALNAAIEEKGRKDGINMIALFDHEEIGSMTKQGAGSFLLRDVIGKIAESLKEEQSGAVYNSILLSVDVAHALHPNQMGKMDITNKPVLNGGFCIKEAGSQSYATDCGAVAIVQQICEQKKISYQKFVNRSDMPGGGTLGSIASSILPVPTIDVGIPLLAMHSAREMMGKEDMQSMAECIAGFFSL